MSLSLSENATAAPAAIPWQRCTQPAQQRFQCGSLLRQRSPSAQRYQMRAGRRTVRRLSLAPVSAFWLSPGGSGELGEPPRVDVVEETAHVDRLDDQGVRAHAVNVLVQRGHLVIDRAELGPRGVPAAGLADALA